MKRLRVVAYSVQATCMVDDDETGELTPIELTAMTLKPSQWPNVVQLVADSLATLDAELADG